jgi:hypothetical protein
MLPTTNSNCFLKHHNDVRDKYQSIDDVYFGKEHYREGTFKLVRGRDKYPNVNGDYAKKYTLLCRVS